MKKSKALFPEYKFILASSSPRRKEILDLINLDYRIILPKDAEEKSKAEFKDLEAKDFETKLKTYVSYLASSKSANVLENNQLKANEIIIAADTVIAFDGKIIGKAKTKEKAYELLKLLSGHTHEVYTAVSLENKFKQKTFITSTKVKFYPFDALQDKLIKSYILEGEAFGKAGAYGIQDFGASFIESIEGDFYTVMGLPLAQLIREISDFITD